MSALLYEMDWLSSRQGRLSGFYLIGILLLGTPSLATVRYFRYSVRTESGRTYDRTNFLIRFFWGGFFLLLEYDPTLRAVFLNLILL